MAGVCGHPIVAWIKRLSASLGGRYMGPSYRMIASLWVLPQPFDKL
jgi:hypothetical protein